MPIGIGTEGSDLQVRDKCVSIHYCPTEINIIDARTKALGPIKIEGFEPQLHGFKPLPEVPDE